MSRIIRCDRCHKDIVGGGVGYIAWNWRDIATDDLIDGNPFEHMDFCEECMAAVKTYVTEPCPCEKVPEQPIIACTETSDKCAETVKNVPISEENAQNLEKPDLETTLPEKILAEAAAAPKEKKRQKGVDLKKLQDLVREGKKPQEIADYFGISLASYYNYRKASERAYIEGRI